MSEEKQVSDAQKSERESNMALAGVVVVVILVICFCITLCFGSIALFASLDDLETTSSSSRQVIETTIVGDRNSESKFLSIAVAGPILTSRESAADSIGIFGAPAMTLGYDVKDRLVKAADEDNYDGIILEITSPGGTIGGSRAISDGVDYYREKTGKPVVAHVTDYAFSGGYWAAISADEIIADYGSITGNIGVIFGPFKYYDGVVEEGSALFGNIVTQNGIETSYVTGGESKDLGNPYRRITSAELEVLQTSIDNEYSAFVDYVSERRGISDQAIRSEVRSLIYDNRQAMELGLIDMEADKTAAYDRLAELAGVDDYRVIRETRPLGFFDLLFMAAGLDQGMEAGATQLVTRDCLFCGQMLMLYGDPAEYRLLN